MLLFVQAAILGIVQGLTEFIPVSSSAHLIIVPWLFGWKETVLSSLSFDVALHLGTLLAVLAFFASDWLRLAAAWFKSLAERKIGADPDRRMAWYLLLACIPGGLAGVLFEGKIEEFFHPKGMPIAQFSIFAMAAGIALLGAVLLLADRLARHDRPISAMGWKDAGIVGLAQALAIFPGVSRSGSTISAGLALGFERPAAARFSFLLSAPIIAGAGLKSALDLLAALKSGAVSSAELTIFPLGFAVAALSGFFCIKFLLDYLQKHSMRVFVYYRWAIAALIATIALVRG